MLMTFRVKKKVKLFFSDLIFSSFNEFNIKPDLLKRFKEAYYFRAWIYTVIVNQVSGSIWAVDFVTFQGFLVAFTAFSKFGAAITIS